jgi:Putative Ig domain
MNRAPFLSRAPLRELLLRTATVIFLSAAATAHAATDGLAISGTPPTSATVGQTYSFTPTVSNPAKRALHFDIWSKPAWATFNTSTGHLGGTPSTANVGTDSNVRIGVTDGLYNAYLPAFTLKVSAATSTADKPVISGTPPTSVTAGSTYKFQPTAKDPDGKALSFSVKNKPSWASFSISSGLLDGTPTSSQSGTYGNIIVSASNGQYSSALPAFSVTVKGATSGTGAATIDWVPPSANTNGSRLTDLAGIRIYYGTSASSLGHMVQVASATATRATIGNLAAGTWYFAGVAYTTTGVESAMSHIVSASIQ